MKITFHGGVGEIGRSCIELQTKQGILLFDAGMKITETGSEYPALRDVHHVDAVALSHAHLDHSGALPFFTHLGLRGQILCTKMTKYVTKILLKDSFKVEHLEHITPLYDESDLYAVLDSMHLLDFRAPVKINNMHIVFFDSGHIPGGSSILVHADGQRVLYTGDINTEDCHLMAAADRKYGGVDILICESTYGNRDHPPRAIEEARFLQDIKEALAKGGSVLIPVLAVGRAQEILLILAKEKWNVPLYLDGMAKRVQARLLEYPELLKTPDALQKAVRKVHVVSGSRFREECVRSQGIFISPSGMLDGGPIVDYLRTYWHHDESLVALTCFQGDGTNGKLLMDEGCVYLDGVKRQVHARVKKYDFSAHIGMTPLHDYITEINPKLLILNHGDPEALTALAGWAKKEKINVRVPQIGDEIVL